MREVDDAYLVCRAQDGFLDAYEELVARHSGRVYRIALRMLGSHHDAQDVTQDVFITAWQRLGQFTGQSAFATWLYRIVTNICLNKIHRTRVAVPLDMTQDVADRVQGPADRAEYAATADAVAAAIAALPAPQRVALVLSQFEGFSYAEIAEITGSTVPAVRSHLHRARRTLATVLREWR